MAVRTHRKMSFDAFILFAVALYNVVYLFTEFIRCSTIGELSLLLLSTFLILLIFYNFQVVLRSMEKEVEKLTNQRRISAAEHEAIIFAKDNQ